MQGKGESKKEAKEAAAKAMLQQIGPYIEDEEWVKYVHFIVIECQMKENGTLAAGDTDISVVIKSNIYLGLNRSSTEIFLKVFWEDSV